MPKEKKQQQQQKNHKTTTTTTTKKTFQDKNFSAHTLAGSKIIDSSVLEIVLKKYSLCNENCMLNSVFIHFLS